MSDALYWLTLTALLGAVLWIPYILERILRLGLGNVLGYAGQTGTAHFFQPDETPAHWANRAARAHANLLEGLPVFAALVLTAEFVQAGGSLVSMAAAVYFIARVVHYVVYVAAIPALRTLSFAVAWVALLAIAYAILTSAGA